MDNGISRADITSILDSHSETNEIDQSKLVASNYTTWFAMNFLMFQAFIVSLIFQIIQVGAYPLLLARILDESGYQDSTIGFYSAFSWIAVFVAGPFVPFVLERCGYKIATTLSLITTVISSVFLLFTSNPLLIGIAAALMGFGLILRWIAFDTLVVELAPEGKRGQLVGLHEALMGLGIALGPALFIFATVKTVGVLFIVCSGPAVLLFSIQSWPSTENHKADNQAGFRPALLAPLCLAIVSASIAGSIESASLSFFPIHFQNFGHAFADTAVFVTAFGLGGTLLQPAIGKLADRVGYRIAHMVCIVSVIIASSLLILTVHNYMLVLLLLLMLGGAAGGFNTLAVIEAGSIMSLNRIPAAMTAIAMSYTFGGVFGPVSAGSAIDFGANQGLLYLFISLSVFLLVIMMRFFRSSKMK